MAAPFGRQRFDQARLINIANGLTAARILLVPLFAYLLISGRFRLALLVFAVCGTSDLLDGLLARWLHQRTVVGFYLDPIADKLLMATSFVMLSIVNVIPVWLTILVISRDIFILVGSLLILLLLGSDQIAASGISKGNTVIQILTVIYFLAIRAFPRIWDWFAAGIEERATETVIALCALSTAASGLHYLVTGIRKLSRA
ncbi:MAG TPA: CDP-alcohol phosphatidyltransferase family protein [Candidatus Deferrimicrobiaceae bacterium]|nr:CDP-alcohol phosphatidyltransferase family protein [Candidatus Deferrimicrobiaceae bacterium]